MAIIHVTTLSPGQLELLAGWLPDGRHARGIFATAQHVPRPAAR